MYPQIAISPFFLNPKSMFFKPSLCFWYFWWWKATQDGITLWCSWWFHQCIPSRRDSRRRSYKATAKARKFSWGCNSHQYRGDQLLQYRKRCDEVAIAIKTTQCMNEKKDFRGLRALKEEGIFKKYILVSRDITRTTDDGIIQLPWKLFLEWFWFGMIVWIIKCNCQSLMCNYHAK